MQECNLLLHSFEINVFLKCFCIHFRSVWLLRWFERIPFLLLRRLAWVESDVIRSTSLILIIIRWNFNHFTFIILLFLVLVFIVIIEEIILFNVFFTWDCFRYKLATGFEWGLVFIRSGLLFFLIIILFIVRAILNVFQLLVISSVFQRVFFWIRSTWRVFSLDLSSLLIKFVLLYFLNLHEIMKLIIVVFRFDITSSKISGLTLSNFFVETTCKLLPHRFNVLLSFLLSNVLLDFHISLPFLFFVIRAFILFSFLPVKIFIINLLIFIFLSLFFILHHLESLLFDLLQFHSLLLNHNHLSLFHFDSSFFFFIDLDLLLLF